ncbi:uncharacterized protein BcabD6B2_22670 [Babesia caballi]|uniref:Uncharacterized protein n=1 Tax=Babesia caballi TaxID=5871 RepID=A0AAV4LT63_BABCB|nr:hypothetical protein BcabD6B2_22670 [Babesia caballi]
MRLHYSANFPTVSNCLGESIANMSRQKGAHNSAKAAEVEAVGATGQCPEARVAGEGGSGGAGGLYSVEEISDVVVTKEVEGGERVRALSGFIIKIFLVTQRLHVLLKAALATAAAAIKTLLSPPAYAFTLPVEVGETDIHDRHDAEEDGGAVFLLTGCKGDPVEVTVG